jgi:peptidoglycan/LPS O-acetylase OafA/YrhL
LRASAILLVVGVHVSQNFTPLIKSTAAFLSHFGAFGVQLFFIVSAYTLLLTFGEFVNRKNIFSFYIRRFFRIAPLFWIAGALYFLRDGFEPRYWAPDGISIKDILLTYTFLNWLTPNSFNSVIPGSWSIGVEMLFYALFPALAFFWKRNEKYLVYFIVVSIYIIGIGAVRVLEDFMLSSAPQGQEYLVGSFFSFWLPRQILAFGYGFLLFQYIQERSKDPIPFIILGAVSFLSVWGASVLGLFLFSYFIIAMKIKLSLASILGRCSYSVYLIHFAVIDFFGFASRKVGVEIPFEVAILLVTGMSLIIANFITKPLIEDPFIRMGKALSGRMSRQ